MPYMISSRSVTDVISLLVSQNWLQQFDISW